MDFTHTEERQMLQQSLSRYIREQYSHAVRMEISESEEGIDSEKYRELCELGIAGVLLPESVGGFGGHGFDISLVFEELGRGLVVEPFLGSALLAGRTLAAAEQMKESSESFADTLVDIMSGAQLAGFAHYEPQSRYELNRVQTQASYQQDHWVLNGHKSLVLNGDAANMLVVSARTSGAIDDEQGISLFMLPADSAGVSIQGFPTIDGYRAADIVLQDVVVDKKDLLFEQGAAYSVVESTVAAGIVALCAEALGAMQVCEKMTTEYLQTREQFGVAIGKFQALQHRLVDITIEIEQTRSAVINAAGHLGADRVAREYHVSAAKNLTGRVARQVAEECIQLHGGIAMTWEYALSHYAKRLVMIDHLLGDTDHHLERFIRFSNN